jgi:uncharacterized membrane protein YbaN (DUF454 family)
MTTDERDGSKRRNPVWHTVKIVIGIALIPVGIVGLFIPVLQGVLVLMLAFALLASEIPAFAKIRDELRRRYPRFFREDG